MTTQSSLSDITTSQSNKDSTTKAEITVSLDSELKSNGLENEARETITEEFDTVDELISTEDITLISEIGLKQSTVETIRQHMDDRVGDDYQITSIGENHVESEWTEKADERADIFSGEFLLEDLAENEYNSVSHLIGKIQTWARAHEDGKHVSKDLVDAAYKIEPNDIGEGELLDENHSENEKKTAVLKARAAMAYADLNGHRGNYLSAAEKGELKVEQQENEEKANMEKRNKAERFLKFPDDEVAGWKRIKYGPNVDSLFIAFRGKYNNAPMVMALFERNGLIDVRGFRMIDWLQADQDPNVAPVEHSIGTTAEDKIEGAADLKEWLEDNPSDEPTKVNHLDTNGWYLTKFKDGEIIEYEDPNQDAKVRAEGSSVILEAHGEKQTEERDNHEKAQKSVIEFIRSRNPIEKGGSEIEVPFPDGELMNETNDEN